MSLEFSGRIRTEDANTGVRREDNYRYRTETMNRGGPRGHFNTGRSSREASNQRHQKATLERGEKPEECEGQVNDRRNTC